MACILVTGATGFVGSYLFSLLAQDGHEVWGTTKSQPRERVLLCDFEDENQVTKVIEGVIPDIIIHCAAISSVISSSAYQYYLSNTVGTENLLKSVAAMGRKRFVFMSTAGVYGNQDRELLSEDLCPKPVHHYGMSKFCCERLVANFSTDLDCSIVRPFNVIGENQTADFIVPKLVRAFSKREKSIELGNINVFRDYIDIHEACEIVKFISFSDNSIGNTYNLCTENPVSISQLIDFLEKISNHKISVEINEKFVRKNEVWKLIGDRTKLNGLIGDQVEHVPIEQSLKRMLTAFERAVI